MLDHLGISAAKTSSPKAIIKLAYSEHLIDGEDTWIRLVNDRNDDAHIYSESAARAYASRIVRDYMPFIEEHISKLQQLIPADKLPLVSTPKSFVEASKRRISQYLFQ